MDAKVEAVKSPRVCRLCLKTGPSYRSLFAEKNKIADKISKCLPILVTPNDELPSHICPLCLRSLNISYKLLIQAIETDGKLRKQLSESQAERLLQESGTVLRAPQPHETDSGNPSICGICEIRFEDAAAFDSHMEMFHQSKWVCNLCQNDFETSEELLQHKHKSHYDNEGTGAPEDNIDCGTIDIKEERISSASDHSDAEQSIPQSIETGRKVPKTPRKQKERGKEEETKETTEPKRYRKLKEDCKVCGINLQETSLIEHMKIHEPYDIACPECQEKFTTAYDFCVHKRDFHNSHPGKAIKFFCRLCNRMMWEMRSLRVHENCKRPRHTCKYCQENFCVKKLLRLHQNKEHRQDMMDDETVVKMSCEYCMKVFVDKKIYYDHVYLHSRSLVYRYPCDFCEKDFGSSSSLKNHIEAIHDKIPKYECRTCKKKFFNKKNLQTHERIHLKLHCKRCRKKFETVELVNQHMKDVHDVPLKAKRFYTCPHCDRKFTRRSIMEDHKNTHSGKTPQTCPICHKKFRTYAARWAHFQRHGSDGFFCDYCQKKFINKRHLKTHIMGHRPSEEWPYICEICGARFPQIFRLTNHRRKHTGEKKYLCDVCGAKYVQKSHLDKHIRKLHITQDPQQ
ncbi:zinc finger protein 62 homolog [Diachasmimorpha longicaudata]|uniref:zinc finger protein 62 homolog n=1 Tax=Diachasmimorpha longicaudata TaxID=58733 RepID=UPI0030B8BFA2